MMSVLVGTALSAAFLPIFSKQYDEKKELGFRYAHQIMSWAVLLLGSVAVLVAITLPQLTDLLVPGFSAEDAEQYIRIVRILLFSPILIAISNIYGRMLHSFKEFLWFGISPVLYNMGIIMGALLLEPILGLTGLVMGAVFGVLMGLTLRLVVIRQRKYGFRHKLDLSWSPEMAETLKLMAPKILQYAMWHLMLASFTSITSQLPEGSVAVYNYARNFQSLPVSLFGIAIAMAAYTSLSHDAGKGNYSKFKRDFKSNRLRSLLYTTLAAIGLALVSKPMVTLLLGGGQFGEEEINLLSNMIRVYCFAVPLESMLHIYHRSFYSLKNTVIPSFLHAFTILLAIGLAKTLSPTVGVFAIPVGFAASLALHVTVLATVFPILLKRHEKAHGLAANSLP